MPAALTIPVGATAAEARQQLVLRTFASTSGDPARTGKVLGLSEQEVRAELLALLNGGTPVAVSARENGSGPEGARPGRRAEAAAPARAASGSGAAASGAAASGATRKPTAKKGR